MTRIESSKSDPSAIFPKGVLMTAPCLYNATSSINTPVFKPKIASLLESDLSDLRFSTLYCLPVCALVNGNKVSL